MDNTTPPPSGGQQNQPPDTTPEGAETERIVIGPSPTPEPTPPTTQPYSPQPEYTPQPENYAAQQPTVPMSGPPPGYQPPQQGAPPQGYQPPQGYAPPPSTPQYQQPYQQPPQQYQQPYPAQQTTVVTPKKGGIPVWAMVLIGLFVALLLACGLIYWLVVRTVSEAGTAITNAGDAIGATVAVGGFDIALSTHDYSSAHDMLGGDLANKYSVADLQSKWEALENGGSVTTKMSDVKMSGNRPQIVWSLTPGGGGTKKDVTLTMSKAADNWKIIEASPDLIPAP